MKKKFATWASVCVLALSRLSFSAGVPSSHFSVQSRFDDQWRASSKSGDIKIELRELRVEAMGPYGKPVPDRIVVLFEPVSGTYSWYAVGDYWPDQDIARQLQLLKQECSIFFRNDSLVVFMGGISPKLYIRDFQGRATDVDDAETKALSLASELHSPPDKQDEEKTWHVVRLRSVGREFVTQPESAVGGPTPKVARVQSDEEAQHWIVTLQARWEAAITLDAEYNEVPVQKTK